MGNLARVFGLDRISCFLNMKEICSTYWVGRMDQPEISKAVRQLLALPPWLSENNPQPLAQKDQAQDMSSLAAMDQSNPEHLQSPGLNGGMGLGPAYEMKVHLTLEQATEIEAWAREHLLPDPHGVNGEYDITSVYCDTPLLDVYHRSPGYKRSKYRLRRYGDASNIFLERKTKRGQKVRKKRVSVPEEQLGLLAENPCPQDWVGAWYQAKLQKKQLFPYCAVTYRRAAFLGIAENGPIRMTFDRQLAAMPFKEWRVPRVENGVPLLKTGVLLEMKFHQQMPVLFRDLLPRLPAQPARASKYRLGIDLCGLKEADINERRLIIENLASRNGDYHADAS